jgi:hypothetical protein
MDLGISKCAIIGCPNNKPMPTTTFKAYIQSHKITYRNQPIPVLHQNEPYVYLGIQLIPSLKWKVQQATTMNKLIKQAQLLLQSPATLKQKLKMVDTVIRPGIAYSFYAVPYSMPNISKLDKKIIGLQKTICGLPKNHLRSSKKHSKHHNKITTRPIWIRCPFTQNRIPNLYRKTITQRSQ